MRLVVLLLVATVSATPALAQPMGELFVHRNSSTDAAAATALRQSTGTSGDRSAAVMSRTAVGVRLEVLFDTAAGAARDVVLNAGEHSWIARFERLDVDAAGFRSWVGHLEHVDNSHVVFTERDGVISGLINAVGTTYQLRTSITGVHVLERIDVHQLGDEREPLAHADTIGPPSPQRSVSAAQDAGDVVDVLMLYTPAARSRMGDTAQIQALASQVISDTNSAFARSGVRVRVRLVASLELGFLESPLMSSDLSAVRSSAEARFLRDAYHADVVQLLVSSPDRASCGIGYLLAPPPADFDAYSVADVACAAQYTPTHEMGHNFGSHHAPEDGASGALFPYSYGFKDQGRGFRTVMAYACIGAPCPRIPNFSNPAVSHDGAATGTELQNNARSLNEAAAIVANFRVSTPATALTPPAPPTGLRSFVAGSSVTVSWNPVVSSSGGGDADTYIVEVGTAPGAANIFNASAGHVTSASGILPAGTYYWRVIAVNAAGASPQSAEDQFAVTGCAPPAAPTNFLFTVSGGAVSLSWNTSPGGGDVSYIVEAGSAPGLDNLLVASVGSNTSVVTTAPPGTYYVRVRAHSACGTSAPSNEHVIVVP